MSPFTIAIFTYIIIVLSAVFHEYAHALTAKSLGDDTAEQAGRLTLNPLKHLDPFGTVLIPILLLLTSGAFIGWAKPVPYNPFNLRDRRFGSLKVAIAGPLSNLLIALVLGFVLRTGIIGADTVLPQLIAFVVYVNIFLALFNLIPVPPLDGSKVLADLFPRLAPFVMQLGFVGIFIALILAYYVLSPVARVVFFAITGIK
jgi:Zn-dependent protease